MLIPLMDDLANNAGAQRPVVAVSGRMTWQRGLVIGGTVNTIAAAEETLTPGEIWTAEQAAAGNKVIVVPPNCTYMEIGAWGDNGTVTQSPAVELWRGHGLPAGGVGGSPDVWSRLFNLLGSGSVTLDGSTIDTAGAAGANRYTIDEGTYQKHLFDLRGARLIVVRLTTTLTGGNWSLWHRFF